MDTNQVYRSILNNLNDVVYMRDLEKNILYLNPAAEKLTGWIKKEALGKKCYQVFSNAARNCHKNCKAENTIVNKMPIRHQKGKVRTLSGDVKDMQVSVTPLVEKNKIIGAIVVMQDITHINKMLQTTTAALQALEKEIAARKLFEKKLKQNEERYRTLYRKTPAMLHSIDCDGKIISASEYWLETLGYDRKEVIGRKVVDFMTRDSRRWAQQEGLPKFFKNGFISKVPLQFVKKNGEVIDVELSAISEKDKKGNVDRSFSILDNVTARNRAESALRKTNAELEERIGRRTKSLEETNAALKVILKQREADKEELEENVITNVKELILPYLEKLRSSKLNADQKTLVEILESNLNAIVSPFTGKLSLNFYNLTPQEIRVADLVRNGKTNKEIAELLNLSKSTILTHRHHLRSKLGLKHKKTNLRSHLLSLS